jgi:hypothetical protein
MAELFDLFDPDQPLLLRAMLDHYLPAQGASFSAWLNEEHPIGARIDAEKLSRSRWIAAMSWAGPRTSRATSARPTTIRNAAQGKVVSKQ